MSATRFDRSAYLRRVASLCNAAMTAALKIGEAIERGEGYEAASAAGQEAQEAFLDALYDLPVELNGKEVAATLAVSVQAKALNARGGAA